MSYADYQKLSHGDVGLAEKYPIPAIFKADIQKAIRLYVLSRVVDFNA